MSKYRKDPRNKKKFFDLVKNNFQKGFLISMITGPLDEYYTKFWT